MTNTRKQEAKHFNVSILNVKVSPKEKDEDFSIMYSNLVKQIFKENLAYNTRGDKFMEIQSLNSFYDENNNEVLFGNLIYYTVLDPNAWYNKRSKTIESIEINSDLFPNAKQTEFFFIPKAHRFCFETKQGGIALSQVEIFLKGALSRVVPEEKEFFVYVEVKEDAINRILQASVLHKITVGLTYSNNDLTEDFEEFLDNDIRESQIQHLSLSAKSFRSETIDLTNSKLLKSAVKLSQSNGYAEAVIENEIGKNEVISTSEYPRKETVHSIAGREHIDVLNLILRLFRNV